MLTVSSSNYRRELQLSRPGWGSCHYSQIWWGGGEEGLPLNCNATAQWGKGS